LLESYEAERVPVIAEMLNITTSLYKLAFQQVTLTALEKASEAAAAAAIKAQTETNMQRAFYRGWKLFQLDVNYRWSEVVFDERFAKADGEFAKNAYGVEGQDVRAGDRAPDAPGLLCLHSATDNNPQRLFDIYSPSRHTVLIFYNGTPDIAKKPVLDALKALPPSLLQKVLILPSSAKEASIPELSGTADYILKDAQGHAHKGFGVTEGGFTIIIVRPDAMIGTVALTEAGLNKYVAAVFTL
jgi:hypothetical protein